MAARKPARFEASQNDGCRVVGKFLFWRFHTLALASVADDFPVQPAITNYGKVRNSTHDSRL
jgi:hypothetical protein